MLPRLYVTKDSADGMDGWTAQFAALGMSGENLALAVERKERSLLLQSKSEATLKGVRTTAAGGKNKETKKKAMSVLEIMSNPPPPPKGWNTFTGTMVVGSTGHA